MSDYVQSKIYGGWDIENCPIPPNFDASNVGRYIKDFLESKGLLGELELHAVAASEKRVSMEIQNKLKDLQSGVNFSHLFNNREKNACDFAILDKIQDWTAQNSPPAVLMVITGDKGFATKLKPLQKKGYLIVVFHKRNEGGKDLTAMANREYDWEEVFGA